MSSSYKPLDPLTLYRQDGSTYLQRHRDTEVRYYGNGVRSYHWLANGYHTFDEEWRNADDRVTHSRFVCGNSGIWTSWSGNTLTTGDVSVDYTQHSLAEYHKDGTLRYHAHFDAKTGMVHDETCFYNSGRPYRRQKTAPGGFSAITTYADRDPGEDHLPLVTASHGFYNFSHGYSAQFDPQGRGVLHQIVEHDHDKAVATLTFANQKPQRLTALSFQKMG